MKSTISIMLLFCGLTSYAQKPTGDWNGELMSMRLIFHVQESDGVLKTTMDSPDQGAKGIPMDETSFENGELTVRFKEAQIEYKGKYDPATETLTGKFSQGGGSFPMTLTRNAIKKAELKRPQTPKSPFPYYTEEVEFTNPRAGVKLSGTLTLPDTKKPHPVVVLISGSGPSTRDEDIRGHKTFMVLADYLTRNGIGVLRYDDRGVAKSTGDYAKATSEDFADDVKAAMTFLEKREDIDHKNIGLMGHSEGGMIAPMVASTSKDVSFIVLLAGPGISGDSISLLQIRRIGKAVGLTDEVINENQSINRELYKMLRENKDNEAIKSRMKELVTAKFNKLTPAQKEGLNIEEEANQVAEESVIPWLRYFSMHDPAPDLEKVTCPVLAINGSKDIQVSSKENLSAISAALKRGGNKHYKTMELENLNHLFQNCTTGMTDEYGKIEETFSPKALEIMAKWIQEVVK